MTNPDNDLDLSKILSQLNNIHNPNENVREEKAKCYLLQSIEKFFKVPKQLMHIVFKHNFRYSGLKIVSVTKSHKNCDF